MNVIVTAGGITGPKQPLYEAAGGGPKSMIDIAGRPMVQWVLDALSASGVVEHVCVVGLPPRTALACAHPVVLLPDHGDMMSNIIAGAKEIQRIDPAAAHAIMASGDIPALRAEMIDWMAGQIAADPDRDIYYTVIQRGAMESQFPASRRTYVMLKDVAVCGGDLHAFRLRAANTEHPVVKNLIAARKNPLRLASLIGFGTLFNLLLRRLALREVETAVARRLGLRVRAIISPYAETGMDVDKPSQLEMLREHLGKRYERNPAKAEPA